MGKRIKKTFRILLALGLALIWLIPTVPVHATTIDAPDNFDAGDEYYPPISDVFITRNLISPDDMLIVFLYNIYYETSTSSTSTSTTGPYSANTTGNVTEYTGSTTNTTYSNSTTTGLPIVNAEKTYVFRLYDTDNSTELGYNYINPYREGGYNHGMGSIYFSPDTAPIWGGSYILSVQGIPDYFATLPDYRVTLSSNNYTTKDTQTECKTELSQIILRMMHSLTLDWGTSLTTQTGQNEVLTVAGANYLQGVMPGIQYILTNLFESYLSPPDYDTAHVWGTNQAANYTERYSAYSWVGNFTGGVGGLMGGSANLGAGMIVAGLAIFCVIWAAMKYQSVLSGFVGSILVLMCGYLVGWLPVAYFGIVAFCLIAYTSLVVFLNRS